MIIKSISNKIPIFYKKNDDNSKKHNIQACVFGMLLHRDHIYIFRFLVSLSTSI